jgi:hypothetical protein
VPRRPERVRDISPGVPCQPVLRLVVEGAIEGATLPAHVAAGTVLTVGVTPFWVGFNAGCIAGRPNDLAIEGVGLSRNSCWFVLRDGRWFGVDEQGTTPLVIDGTVARWTLVRDGAVVDLGRARCRARVAAPGP